MGGSTWESPGATGRRYLVYSITKTFFVLIPPESRPIASVVLSAGQDGGAQETALALLAAV